MLFPPGMERKGRTATKNKNNNLSITREQDLEKNEFLAPHLSLSEFENPISTRIQLGLDRFRPGLLLGVSPVQKPIQVQRLPKLDVRLTLVRLLGFPVELRSLQLNLQDRREVDEGDVHSFLDPFEFDNVVKVSTQSVVEVVPFFRDVDVKMGK